METPIFTLYDFFHLVHMYERFIGLKCKISLSTNGCGYFDITYDEEDKEDLFLFEFYDFNHACEQMLPLLSKQFPVIPNN